MTPLLLGFVAVTIFTATGFLLSLMYRRVVPTNEVHIVQTGKKTISYGSGSPNGNTYFMWPTWLPHIGVTRTVLPVNVFDIRLNSYDAYDLGRVPFVVDVVAFYKITDSNQAAGAVASFKDLEDQLTAITQGAVRSILASNEIETILQSRSTFGEQFTKEVAEQLQHWGVSPVKNMELMDIRDSQASKVIANIMMKKQSKIDMESRTAVAGNQQVAKIAEINAKRETDLQAQEAEETVGLRTATKNQKVGIADQMAQQNIQIQAKTTAENEMAVKLVKDVRQAEITSKVSIVKADQDKQVAILNSEAEKQKLILVADGNLEQQKRHAEGVKVNGEAAANAEELLQVAQIAGNIALAKEIGGNEGYQNYLVTIRQVEATQAVGIENAKALTAADIKVIANSGSAVDGIKSVADMFSSKGGQSLAAMIEGLAQTDHGQALINKFLPGSTKDDTKKPTASK